MNLLRYVHVQFLSLALATIISSIYAFILPATVPTHWNIRGEADAFGPRSVLLFLGPGLVLFNLALTLLLPNLPKGEQLAESKDSYFQVMGILSGFFVLTHWSFLQAAVSGQISQLFLPVLCLMFSALGSQFHKMKPNPYMGIRTPWTMNDETVWNLTHARARHVWFWGGLIGAALSAAGLGMAIVLPLVVLLSLWPIADSYLLSRK